MTCPCSLEVLRTSGAWLTHADLFGHGAHFERDVQPRRFRNLQDDAGHDVPLEAGELHGHRVLAGRQGRERVGAFLVGVRAVADVRRDVGRGDDRARHDRAVRVGHRPGQRGAGRLAEHERHRAQARERRDRANTREAPDLHASHETPLSRPQQAIGVPGRPTLGLPRRRRKRRLFDPDGRMWSAGPRCAQTTGGVKVSRCQLSVMQRAPRSFTTS